MNNILKDIAVLLFAAGDEIESKAGEFKKQREERFKNFEEKLKDTKENIITKLGFASKDEIDDLKKKIDNLASKIDSLGK